MWKHSILHGSNQINRYSKLKLLFFLQEKYSGKIFRKILQEKYSQKVARKYFLENLADAGTPVTDLARGLPLPVSVLYGAQLNWMNQNSSMSGLYLC